MPQTFRDHGKNEVEAEEMSENDASIDSSINEGKAHLIVLWKFN